MKKELLNLAKKTILSKLDGKEFEPSRKIKENFSEKRACFVTLMYKGELRGCIGCMEPRQELWKEVVCNSLGAGFSDPRFPPVTKKEISEIKIEISILSNLIKIDYQSFEELKNKIKNKGVLLKKGRNSATYLPQVWEQINDEEEFLNSLCLKAGLSFDSWREKEIEIYIYEVEKIKEN